MSFNPENFQLPYSYTLNGQFIKAFLYGYITQDSIATITAAGYLGYQENIDNRQLAIHLLTMEI